MFNKAGHATRLGFRIRQTVLRAERTTKFESRTPASNHPLAGIGAFERKPPQTPDPEAAAGYADLGSFPLTEQASAEAGASYLRGVLTVGVKAPGVPLSTNELTEAPPIALTAVAAPKILLADIIRLLGAVTWIPKLGLLS
jgi:hypothetical protein